MTYFGLKSLFKIDRLIIFVQAHVFVCGVDGNIHSWGVRGNSTVTLAY